jgi:hypothetical protein
MLSLHARDLEKGGWLRRYGFPASICYFINVLALHVTSNTQLASVSLLPCFVLAFICVQLTLRTIIGVS